jgi:hypothetical protein
VVTTSRDGTSGSLVLSGSVTLLVGVLTLCGCSDQSGRSLVEGRVTWEGKPVPAGSVAFEPDPDRGGKGPAGVALIRNGRFRTEAKFGAVAGPHIARFWFFDGQGGDALSPSGRMICPEFTEPVDLPGKAVTIDFDFPRQK